MPVVVALLISIGVLVLHTQRFPRFFFDDSFISLRYADRFRNGYGLSWTDGEYVEGFSNFLWVVLIGAIGLFHDDLILPARVLGVLATSIAIAALTWAHRSRSWRHAITALFPGLAVAVLGPIAAWSVGGLEAPLILAGLGLSIALAYEMLERRAPAPRLAIGLGLSLTVLTLSRPDGALFTAVFSVFMFLARQFSRAAWTDALVFGGISSLAFVALSVFRRSYFGAWVPNTSFKLDLSSDSWSLGWNYIVRDCWMWMPLCALAVMSLIFAVTSGTTRKRVVLILPALAAWLLYVTAIGGDFMPQRRHLVPALFLVVALAAETITRLSGLHPRALLASWGMGLMACGLVAGAQRSDWAVADANKADWYWEAKPIGDFFQTAFGDRRPLLAVDAAGALPYFSRLRALDMVGLNDRYIATHPPQEHNVTLAHGLGNGRYVLTRKPDLVVFNLPRGDETPRWRSGREMVASGAFHAYYQRLYYVTPVGGIEGVVYIRREDGVLAPQWSGGQLRMPAYLFATRADTRATANNHGHVLTQIAADKLAIFPDVELRPGRCTARVTGSNHLVVRIEAGQDTRTASPDTPVAFDVVVAQRATFTVTAPEIPGLLREVSLDCT